MTILISGGKAACEGQIKTLAFCGHSNKKVPVSCPRTHVKPEIEVRSLACQSGLLSSNVLCESQIHPAQGGS